jgi:hypothetical protein
MPLAASTMARSLVGDGVSVGVGVGVGLGLGVAVGSGVGEVLAEGVAVGVATSSGLATLQAAIDVAMARRAKSRLGRFICRLRCGWASEARVALVRLSDVAAA